MFIGLMVALIVYAVAVRHVVDTRDGRDWAPDAWPRRDPAVLRG